MAHLILRHNRYSARIRVPKERQKAEAGKEFLQRTLGTSDRKAAKVEADAWEAMKRLEWATQGDDDTTPSRASLRALYEQLRDAAAGGKFELVGDLDEPDTHIAGIHYELEKLSDTIGEREETDAEAAKIAALQDGISLRRREPLPRRPELEATFRDLADEHLRLWRLKAELKETHTEQQKIATFDLFASYFGDRSLRDVRRADGSAFVDALRQMDPNWARSGRGKSAEGKLNWQTLQKEFGGRDKGLSDATVNRHMATLSAFWKWGEEREHCDGRNPFDGHRRALKNGKNKRGYVAWESTELTTLFNPPPKRSDLTEIMLVAMFTGMRLNEIASLTYGQITKEHGIPLIDVTDAKTVAGIRQVPLHSRLGWLSKRAEKGKPSERIWSKFVPEGPAARPGRDAGKEFSRFKAGLGFTERSKAFHSFRKNGVGQLERARVPENEVAVLVGHEKQGFTFNTYGETTLLQRLAEIVALIEYPDVTLPEPSGKA